MSEPTTSAPAVPTPPSPVTSPDGPNTVIFPPDAPAPDAPAQPEPPAPPAPPSDPWKIQTLENGQREVTLPTGQVYRGTNDEVLNQLAKAQTHASQRITELGQLVPPPAPPAPTGPQVDPTAKALADLTAQGMGFANADEYLAELNQVRTGYQQTQNQQTAQQFLAVTPDFPKSQENADKIDATLVALGLPATVQNLQVAHHYLKGTGQYVAVAAPPATSRPAGMPLPPNGTTNQPVEQDPWSMPLDQLRNLATGRS
jgi:hypothetical protein